MLAKSRGIGVTGWDRGLVDPEDTKAAAEWLDAQAPAAIAHLAMGSADWAGRLARFAAQRTIPFVYTSTAMVFDSEPNGPHEINAARNAKDEYGRYKIRCENAIRSMNPDAIIVRIGWQIDAQQPGNNMLMALDSWQERDGFIAASRTWKPACSFMTDTANVLAEMMTRPVPGLHHFDSNADEGHSFDQIVLALKEQFSRAAWQVRVNEDYRHDQRLTGGSLTAPRLSARLRSLVTSPNT
jgi:dTDP-4-dehydrorhamnose reductase